MSLLKVKLPYDQVYPSIAWYVGQSVCQSTCDYYGRREKLESAREKSSEGRGMVWRCSRICKYILYIFREVMKLRSPLFLLALLFLNERYCQSEQVTTGCSLKLVFFPNLQQPILCIQKSNLSSQEI